MLVLRRLYSRQSASSKYLKKPKVDPGINWQKKLIKTSTDDVEDVDFEELESDFMGVHQSHREHVDQMNLWREKEKYLIVKQKYFKEKFPNFLTWHDKEQIKYLHNKDSEEWSIERLSEGFPALPDIIEKVAKAKWTKKNTTKIANHDKAVMQNWSDFKQGKLNNLPDELKKHLQQFSRRSLNLEPFQIEEDEHTITSPPNKKSGEFSEIIASYERLKNKNNENDKQNDDVQKLISERNETSKTSNDKQLVTFKQLQSRIKHNVAKGKEISIQEELIMNKSQLLEKNAELQPESISKIVNERFQVNSNKVGFVRKTTKDVSHLTYPEKIVIPNKIYKRGSTYKLYDCYYDCNGDFLYRVPGME